jgi:hypothetical protein
MKRLLFLLSSSLLFTQVAHAQLGVRGGGNLLGYPTQTATDNTRVSATNPLGYQVGVLYQLPLTKHFSLVPEVQFSREHIHVSLERYSPVLTWQGFYTSLQTTQGDYQLHLSYVNVPVLLRYTLGPVYLEAGPQVSTLVGGQGKGQVTYLIGGDGRYSREISQAATDRFRRFDVGASVGVGVTLPAGLGLSIRAYQGFIKLDKAYTDQDRFIPYVENDRYRQTLQASLTYQLRGHS